MTSIFFSLGLQQKQILFMLFLTSRGGGGGATPGENGKAAHPLCSAFLTDHNSNCLVLTGLDKKKKKIQRPSQDLVKMPLIPG